MAETDEEHVAGFEGWQGRDQERHLCDEHGVTDGFPKSVSPAWNVGVHEQVHADEAEKCLSCGRSYARMGSARTRLANGHLGHLEKDPVTGATILFDEGEETAR